MKLLCRLERLLISLWLPVCFVPGIKCSNGNVNHLSREDVLLLKDEPNLKCFTRTMRDFTCFFETVDNRTHDLFYTVNGPKKRCAISVQRTEEGTFLHICSFPRSEVYLYIETHLEVIDPTTNTSLYKRSVEVQKHVLLDPPSVSLHPASQVAQLSVSSHIKRKPSSSMKTTVKYRIQYSSRDLEEERKETGNILDSLIPGEEVKVQGSVKTVSEGHWSSWSQPVRAVVPQRADDISLVCFTSDLDNVTCNWNGSRYGGENKFHLFYKIGLSEPLTWTDWQECLADENIADLCRFRGGQSSKVRVMLGNLSSPISRTFYTEEFMLRNSIKTSPPTRLKRVLGNDKLCLEWEAPLKYLSTQLLYEVKLQLKEDEGWRHFRPEIVKGPKTESCVEFPAGSQYSVMVRAKPTGPIYSGYWSDWSHAFIGETPSVIGMQLIVFISISILVTAIILITLISVYISKLKQYLWPPLPNLEKVLQGYLTEINRQKRDPPVLEKQCAEEIASSVVEILPKDKSSELGKPLEESTELLSSEGSFTNSEQVDGSPEAEFFPDYVTLSKDSLFICPQGNIYIYEHVNEKVDPEIGDEVVQTCHCSCSDGSICVTPCSCIDLLNHTYLPLDEHADKFSCKVIASRSPRNIYTNFP